jgi:para-nitrobenzyl esterase
MKNAGWCIAVLCAAIVPALGQSPATLTGLDVGAYKTDIEKLNYKLDQPFSPSTMSYTLTVEASYTENLVITPKAPSGASVTINGAAAKTGEENKVPLALGANKFRIAVASGGQEKTWELNVNRKDASKEYTSESIGKGMWRVKDFGGYIGNESMYLIEGKDRAILFDTGMGTGDIAGYVKTLTKLPVDVAITHGNRDHFAQVDKFKDSTVYLSPLDVTRLGPELITPKYQWLKPGDVVDIGNGRKFEAVYVPGHTLGSIVYTDWANKIAITGDAVSSGSMVYMFGSACGALDEYLAGLKKFEVRLNKLDGITLLVGHNYQERTPLNGKAGKQLITDMRTAAEKVLAGEAEGKLTHTGRDARMSDLRQLNVGLAGLWYNPSNLRTDPAALEFLKVQTSAGKDVIPRPVFSSFVTSYTAAVPADVAKIEITPTPYWPKSKGITINGKAAKADAPFAADVVNGENKYEIAVTPETGAVRTYTVVVTRK